MTGNEGLNLPTWVRWIAVLPACIAGAILSGFVLHFVLYATLTGSGIVQPYPELPERILFPGVAALAFVWSGAKTAPERQFETAAVLCVLWVILVGFSVMFAVSGSGIGRLGVSLQYGGAPTILSVVGAIIGFFILRNERTAL